MTINEIKNEIARIEEAIFFEQMADFMDWGAYRRLCAERDALKQMLLTAPAPAPAQNNGDCSVYGKTWEAEQETITENKTFAKAEDEALGKVWSGKYRMVWIEQNGKTVKRFFA